MDSFTLRVEDYEHCQGTSKDMTTLKAYIVGLRRDVDKMKSINLSMLFSTMDLLVIPGIDF